MLLFCKLWGLSWSYRDGAIVNDIKIANGKFDVTLSNDDMKTSVHDFPNFIEFHSFVLFFGGCLIGPFFEFSDFKNWIEMTGQYKSLPNGPVNGF